MQGGLSGESLSYGESEMKTIYRCGECGEIANPGDVEIIERDEDGYEEKSVEKCPNCGLDRLKKDTRFGHPRMTKPLTLKTWGSIED